MTARFERPPEASEVELPGLETRPSGRIAVPRLKAPPVAMEWRFRQCLELGQGPQAALIVGEAVMVHTPDGLLSDRKVDARAASGPLSCPLAPLIGPTEESAS